MSGQPNIILRDEAGQMRATLGAVSSSEWALDLFQPGARSKGVRLGIGSDGKGFLTGHDTSGRVIWHVP